jgi:hypothetical protein
MTTAPITTWLLRHGDGVIVWIIVAGSLAMWLLGGCVQARAPGSVASLAVFSSRVVATGTASNVTQTVEGGASPSTTATVPIR